MSDRKTPLLVVVLTLFGVVAGCGGLGVIAGIATASAARAEESLVDAALGGRGLGDLRYRFERVDQDGRAEIGRANTAHVRLGYETGSFLDTHMLIEFETIVRIGAEDYNDTYNRKTRFPVIADPEATEMNQGYLDFKGLEKTSIRVGRQRINIDNQRFVGGVAFRQNEQTFDAATVTTDIIADTRIRYGYVLNINTIFGDGLAGRDRASNTHLFNVGYDGFEVGKLTGYSYLVDTNNFAQSSSATIGLRFSGRHAFEFAPDVSVLYTAETARQWNYGGNPGDFSLGYVSLEPGLGYRTFTARLGYEFLDGDGADAFQTPLGTNHAFNGITDLFLTTPADGLQDAYLKLAYRFEDPEPLRGTVLKAAYHQFWGDRDGRHFGSEWNLTVARTFKELTPLNASLTLSAQFAAYKADRFGADVNKLWLTAQFKF